MLSPLPNLDDRRWADLVEEGRALLPVYARDWTDHNVHDPGITCLEMLAAVAEMDIFQLNRVPERHQRKFLSLVGIEPRPPQPAHTVVAFEMQDNSGTLDLPAGTALATADGSGIDVPFRLLHPLTAVAGRVAAVLVREGARIADRTQRFTHAEPVEIFGSAETPGAALYLGFTEALPAAAWTSLYFRFGRARASWKERRHILEETQARARACAPRPNPCAPAADPEACSGMIPPHQSARVLWEYRTAAGGWLPLSVTDDTRSFTLDGPVLLRPDDAGGMGGVDGAPEHLYFIRATFQAGMYDAAPLALRIVLNGVEAEQTLAIATRLVGNGNGESDQTLSLTPAPIAGNRLNLWSVEAGCNSKWIRRGDFDNSGRTDRDYVLEGDAGLVRLGDGEHGLVPGSGVAFYASYFATRAEEGNLAGGRVFRLLDSIVGAERLARVTNSVAAVGGAASESVTAAAGRAIEELRAPYRAVSSSDFEMLALETAGTDLARVAVVPNCHRAFECILAPGVVAVIPVPYLPARAPMPSPGTIELVARYLNRRRIVGTRVEVLAPRYLAVAVRTSVRALPGSSPALLEQRLRAALDKFLDPLLGGPGETGWPFGRDVYRSEVLQILDATDGVDNVVSLQLVAGSCGPACGNVCVPALWLVTPGVHEIQIV